MTAAAIFINYLFLLRIKLRKSKTIMTEPFISICIPAYKRTDFLQRVLDSIRIQSFKDYEVVVTDDSPDGSVKALTDSYSSAFNLRYFKNPQNLGTPENWNEGIRKASGKWIKIMHDDDWFSDEHSLQKFALEAQLHERRFIFSGYTNHYLDENREEAIVVKDWRLKQLKKNSAVLFASNIIGPPSVCMHRNDGKHFYDKETKWLVDIDFYIRRLAEEDFSFISEPLVNVGLSAEQVTQSCFRNATVEIPEHFHVLKKIPSSVFKNPIVYDAWWRLFRNLKIRSEEDIRSAGYRDEIPKFIFNIFNFQSKIPSVILSNGIVSKSLMFFHYLINKKTP
jgi:glycosyltransferase involved in cell wall biosynthesis